MPNRIIENQKRLQQKCHSTSSLMVGAGFSWRVRALSGQSFDLRFPVPLVPQQTGMSCWAAGAAMVVAWRENYSADPAQIAQAAGAWASYSAGLHPESTAIFPIWGLTPEPPQSYSVDGLRRLLDTYGPLWVAGAVPGPHIRVVTGMYGDGSLEGTKVLINDPWQQGMTTFTLPNAGAQYEETYSQFVAETERLARQETQSFPRAIYVARSTRPRASRAQARSLSGFTRAHGTRPSYRFVPNVRALSIPVDFDVPRPVPDLKKPSPMTCWAAATAMLVSYKEGKPVSVEEAVRRAGGRYEQLLQSDAVLAKADMADYLSALGLTSQPAAELSVEQVDKMLRRFGAVWLTPDDNATFSLDARIVTGIHGDGTPSGTNVVVLDPGTGTAAPVAFARLSSIFQRQSLSNSTMHLMAIHWLPDTLGAAVPQGASPSDVLLVKDGQTIMQHGRRQHDVILASSTVPSRSGQAVPTVTIFELASYATFPRPWPDDAAEVTGIQADTWLPAAEDFDAIGKAATAASGGTKPFAQGMNTFADIVQTVTYFAPNAVGFNQTRPSRVRRLNLFLYSGGPNLEFSGTLRTDGLRVSIFGPNVDLNASVVDLNVINNIQNNAANKAILAKLRSAWMPGAEIWLYSCAGVPDDALAAAFAKLMGAQVRAFTEPFWVLPRFDPRKKTILARDEFGIGANFAAAAARRTKVLHSLDSLSTRSFAP